jgi:hypothetical protein
MSKKIEIVNLDLGIDPEQTIKRLPISQPTSDKIDKVIDLNKKEQAAFEKVIEKRQQKQTYSDIIETLLANMLNAAANKQELSGTEILTMTKSNNLSGIMLRLRNLVKRRGNNYKIISRREDGISYYSLEINQPLNT